MIDHMEALATAVLGHDPDGHEPTVLVSVRETHGEDGLAAAWAWLCQGGDDITATLHNMKNYKGHYADMGEYARAFYGGLFDDATDTVLPEMFGGVCSDYVDWDELGDDLAIGELTHVIVVDSGVHVWDATT
jgi:hypothetical protein